MDDVVKRIKVKTNSMINNYLNPLFIGRETLLADIKSSLADSQKNNIIIVKGIAGIGKTQFSLKYAQDNFSNYDCILWINANQINIDFLYLFKLIYKEESLDIDLNEKIQLVINHLIDSELKYLIIIDNVEFPEELNIGKFIPVSKKIDVIITSQHQDWGFLKNCESYQINKLSDTEALELIKRRISRSLHDDDISILKEICLVLGEFPLAIIQAGGYIANTPGMPIAYYLEQLKQNISILDQKNDAKYLNDYGYKTLVAIWKILINKINGNKSHKISNFMSVLAFLNGESIDTKFIYDLDFCEKVVEAEILEISNELNLLHSYSMLSTNSSVITIHSLLQRVIRDYIDSNEQEKWKKKITDYLIYSLSQYTNDVGDRWDEYKGYIRHSTHIIQFLNRHQDLEEIAWLTSHVGRITLFMGDIDTASNYLEDSIDSWKRLGVENVGYMVTLTNAGILNLIKGNNVQAEEYLKKSLEIEYSEGDENKETLGSAETLMNLGILKTMKGLYPEAICHLKKAKSIFNTIYGPNHPEIANCLINLANAYGKMGKLPKVKKNLNEALSIFEKYYDNEHHNIASVLTNLGVLYRQEGDISEAKHCLFRALKIDKKWFGNRHYRLPPTYTSLGNIYFGEQNYDEAEKYYTLSIDINESLNVESYSYAVALSNLGLTKFYQDLPDEAEQLLLKSLKLKEKIFEMPHYEIADNYLNLAVVYVSDIKRKKEGIEKLNEAISIYRKTLGNDHIKTQNAITLLMSQNLPDW